MLKRINIRRIGSIGLIGLTIITIKNVRDRYNDEIEENDQFSIYTNSEHKKNILSGMHQPFITNDDQQLSLFRKYFPQYEYLISKNINEINEKHSLKTPVRIKSLSEYNNEDIDYNTDALIVGGAPALMSSIYLIKNKKNFIYLNNFQRIPISNGSAWHLEYDACTEAPTNYRPTTFLFQQLKRLLLMNVSLKSIQETGEFAWRTINWIEWIRYPDHWYRAMKIFIKYQLFTMFHNRISLLNDVSKQCIANELFFDQLNKILNNKILLEGYGSIIVARNQEELHQLQQFKNDLSEEGRTLNILSHEQMFNRYGFVPNGLGFAEKAHDRVLAPNFIRILNDFIVEQGRTVLDGTLETIYKDETQNGGIALFKDRNGQSKFIKFSHLILSLGNQEIFNKNNKRLFDVVAARGVSMLAHVYLPKDFKLPPVLVCGGTNHATKLSSSPFRFDENYDLYLMRLTAGACITPNVSDQYAAYYDSTIAFGLLQSVKNTLGDQCKVEPIFVYGCNRQVSQNGQIHWIEPYKNIFIQYGAGGGGLTRAPDFITKFGNSFL